MPLDKISQKDLESWEKRNNNLEYPIYIKIDTLTKPKYKYMKVNNKNKIHDLAHTYFLETQIKIIDQEYFENMTKNIYEF